MHAQVIVPTFHTERLILREIVPGDIPAYQRNFNDWEVIRHLSRKVPWPYPEDGVKVYCEQLLFPNQGKSSWNWGLFLREHPDELIGTVALYRPGIPESRGFWLARRLWGQGLMTEAVIPVMDYAFAELGYECMILSNAVGNTRSGRVKEKTGAKLLRTAPMEFVDPTYTHSEYWEISAEAWRQFRAGIKG